MRRAFLVLVCLAVLALAPAALGETTKANWAKADIQAVVAAGLMGPSVAEFRSTDALTKGELAEILVALGKTPAKPVDPTRPVKLWELDASLVKALGLAKSAKRVRSALAGAGLQPPGRAGTEVVARLLGLRLNHPQDREKIELGPEDPISRAETAYSLARVLELRDGETVASVRAKTAAFSVPELTDWQRAVLTRAVKLVGYPYIWGGTSEKSQWLFGHRVPGGFDCSGLVWRVYKIEPYEGAPGLADVLRGRTTYEMSGEVKKKARIPFDAIVPGDVIFFGSSGPESKPGDVGHMGINLGNGWFVHSSSRGTTIAELSGWYRDTFAWARRPLAEAGLE
jgi:cell wall-associated NlpC family hydrolase